MLKLDCFVVGSWVILVTFYISICIFPMAYGKKEQHGQNIPVELRDTRNGGRSRGRGGFQRGQLFPGLPIMVKGGKFRIQPRQERSGFDSKIPQDYGKANPLISGSGSGSDQKEQSNLKKDEVPYRIESPDFRKLLG